VKFDIVLRATAAGGIKFIVIKLLDSIPELYAALGAVAETIVHIDESLTMIEAAIDPNSTPPGLSTGLASSSSTAQGAPGRKRRRRGRKIPPQMPSPTIKPAGGTEL
jgi:hypothetical protein